MIESTMLARDNASGLVRRELPGSGVVTAADVDVAAWLAAVQATDATVTQAVVDLYDEFVIGVKTDDMWNGINDLGVFLGPSTLAGALVKLKGNSIPLTNFNFVSGDYSQTGGLQGGATKYLSTGKTMIDIGLLASPPVQLGHALFYDISTDYSNGTQYKVLNGTSSLSYRVMLGYASAATKVRCANSSSLTHAAQTSGPMMVAYYGGNVLSLTSGGFTSTAAAYSGGSSGTITLMGRTTNDSVLGIGAGYSLGTGPSTGWDQTKMQTYRDRWDTLVAGLMAL